LDRPIGLLVYEEFLKRREPRVRALCSLMEKGKVVGIPTMSLTKRFSMIFFDFCYTNSPLFFSFSPLDINEFNIQKRREREGGNCYTETMSFSPSND
jgi:hypothetical protein